MPIFALILVLIAALMHTSWNLLVHSQNQDRYFLVRLSLFFGLIGVGPLLIAEWLHPVLTPLAWSMLAVTIVCQAMYQTGLTMGYRSGDFTVIYPLVRALPIIALAVVDIVRDRMPSLTGWIGIFMATIGCSGLALVAIRSRRHGRWSMIWFWIALAALGTIGYCAADKIALESMPKGINAAWRYAVIEFLFGAMGAGLCLGATPISLLRSHSLIGWIRTLFGAALLGGSYVLILWAYQFVDQVSYVAACRQISIAIGVIMAAWLLHEHVGLLRIILAVVITAAVALIAIT